MRTNRRSTNAGAAISKSLLAMTSKGWQVGESSLCLSMSLPRQAIHKSYAHFQVASGMTHE